MISWNDVNKLQSQKSELEVELNKLLKSGQASQDDINELKAEILHLKININRILGSNEVERQKELKKEQSGLDEKHKKRYYAFKRKYDMISKLNEATNNIINSIESLNNTYEIKESKVKVKAA